MYRLHLFSPPYKLMKLLVIWDIHGRDTWKAKAESFIATNDDGHVVFMWDYFDSFDPISVEEQLANMRDILEFYHKYHRSVTLLLGNHDCFVEGTEFLTKGWRKNHTEIVDTDLLAQFDYDRNISYAKPISKIIKHINKKCVLIESWKTKQIVTNNHDVVVYWDKIKAHNLLWKRIIDNAIYKSWYWNICSWDNIWSIAELYWFVMCDATIVSDKWKLKRIQFHLSKQRKISYIEWLLNNIWITYTKSKGTYSLHNILQPYMIRIYGDTAREIVNSAPMSINKDLSRDILKYSNEDFAMFLKWMSNWDWRRYWNRLIMVSINKNNLDIIQESCLLRWIDSSITDIWYSWWFKNSLRQYKLVIYNYECNTRTRWEYLNIKEEEYKGLVVCYTMPKGTLITRMNWKIAFSWNCHYLPKRKDKCSWYQHLWAYAISELLKDNLDLFEIAIYIWNFLISHAGITDTWLRDTFAWYDVSSSWHEICAFINAEFETNEEAFKFNKRDSSQSWNSTMQWPLWVRPPALFADAVPWFWQIVWHTEMTDIVYEHGIYFVDCLWVWKFLELDI